jgi:hypothetical protein
MYKRTDFTTYLGLVIDDKLTWAPHVENITKSLLKYFGIFYRIKEFVPRDLKKQVFCAYVQSKIRYGLEAYGSMSQTLKDKLQGISNKLLRLLFLKDRTYSTDKLHHEIKLLKINDLYTLRLLQFTHKCLFDCPNPIFKNYFKLRSSMHDIHTRDNGSLHIPRVKSALASSAVNCKAASLWNTLSIECRKEKDPVEFKTAITKLIIQGYC